MINSNNTQKSLKYLEKQIKNKENGIYKFKYLHFGLNDAVLKGDSIIFQFQGQIDSLVQISFDFKFSQNVDLKIKLNNVLIADKNLLQESMTFTVKIDKDNIIELSIIGVEFLRDIAVDMCGNLEVKKSCFDYKIVKNVADFAVVKHSLKNEVYVCDKPTNYSNVFTIGSNYTFDKETFLDFTFVKDASGNTNQSVLLKYYNGVDITIVDSGEDIHVSENCNIGTILESSQNLCMVALAKNNNLEIYLINFLEKSSHLISDFIVDGEITCLCGAQLINSDSECLCVVTSQNKCYVMLFTDEKKPYIYTEIENCCDAHISICENRIYLFAKNSDKKISFYIYQLPSGAINNQKLVYKKSIFNCDYAYFDQNKIYYISNNLCSEETFEKVLF